MSLVDAKSVRPALTLPIGASPVPGDEPDTPQVSGPSPGWFKTLQAGLENENIVGSTTARILGGSLTISNAPEIDYSAWADIKGTPYEEHWKTFAESNNPRYTAFLKSQIDRENENDRTLAAAGWGGTIAALGSSIFDPTILIPVGGEIALAGKGVWTFAKGARLGARAGFVGTGAQEVGLQGSQELRSVEESAINIGSSVVLGSLLGGSAAKLLTRGEQIVAGDALENLHRIGTEPVSAGAMATPRASVVDLTVAGNISNRVAETTKFISPNMRANFRYSPAARQHSQELAENTLYQTMHAEGRSLGAAVETQARITYNARLAEAVTEHEAIFRDSKKAGLGLSRQQFEESVALAMRRGDVGENDFVTNAAKAWRARFFDPFKDEAIEMKLLDPNVDVTTATSYFSRLWNKEQLTAQEPDFKDIVTRHYEQELARDHADSVARLQAELAKHDEIVGDLNLAPKKRAERVGALQTEADQFDAANAPHVDRISNVNDLRARAKEAEARGDAAEGRALRDEAKKAYADGGDDLKKYLAKRRSLRSRRARLTDTPATAGARKSRIVKIAEKKAAAERSFNERWGSRLDPDEAGFKSLAGQIADDVFDKLTGRAQTSSASVLPEYLTPITRGPLKERTFNIPDVKIEKFLENNIRTVGERYGRTMAAEIELTRKFGRADMRDQIQAIQDEYRALREEVARTVPEPKLQEKKLIALRNDEKGALEDLQAMRDLIRGTYKATENASNYGRAVRGVMAFNYIRSMGGAVIANIAELYRPAMVHGLGRYMSAGIKPLLTNLDAVKMSVKEAKLSGLVTERVLQNRMMSLGEIGDPYRSGTSVERMLTNAARTGSKWNGLVYWTDAMKSLSSVLSQNRIVEAALSAGEKDTRLLAYLGIDKSMTARVAKQFADHGDTIDGVKIANTQMWGDELAVRAYRAAVAKDVDSIIVTRSVGDIPLFANTPTGKMILQFRNYTFAAHQRVMLRGMQEGRAQFLSSMIGMTSLGMMGAVMRSWRGGNNRFERFEEAATNPGYLIGEGLDLSGMFSLPIELANTIEKVTQPIGVGNLNPLKTPLLAAGGLVNPEASMQGSSVRFVSRDPMSAILGPSFGLISTTGKALGAPINPTESRTNAVESMLPFGSYLGMREVLQLLTDDSPYVEENAQ